MKEMPMHFVTALAFALVFAAASAANAVFSSTTVLAFAMLLKGLLEIA